MLRHAVRASAGLVRMFNTRSPFLQRTDELLIEKGKALFKAQQEAAPLLKKQATESLPKGGIYKHPYCTPEFPLMLRDIDNFRVASELVGPEQVSPHFQSVEEFGRWFTYFFIALAMCVNMRTHHNHAFGYAIVNMMFGLEVWIYVIGMYFARCTVLITPNPWKLLYIKYDLESMQNNLYELEEAHAEEQRKEPIGQIDYFRLHKEYFGMKSGLMDTYLKTHRLRLKQHLYERSLAVLRGTEKMEQDNVNKVLRELLQRALEKVQENATNGHAETKAQAFKSALQGIRDGKMTYKNDPLLPVVQKYLEEFLAELEHMYEADFSKAIGLTDDQRIALKASDARAEQHFLAQMPAIKHPKVLAHPLFQRA